MAGCDVEPEQAGEAEQRAARGAERNAGRRLDADEHIQKRVAFDDVDPDQQRAVEREARGQREPHVAGEALDAFALGQQAEASEQLNRSADVRVDGRAAQRDARSAAGERESA